MGQNPGPGHAQGTGLLHHMGHPPAAAGDVLPQHLSSGKGDVGVPRQPRLIDGVVLQLCPSLALKGSEIALLQRVHQPLLHAGKQDLSRLPAPEHR